MLPAPLGAASCSQGGSTEDAGMTESMSSGAADSALADSSGRLLCQVADCEVDLRSTKAYCIKKRLCPDHLTAQAVKRRAGGDNWWRFCQQCGKLEPVEAFDGTKRSCRARLQKRRAHNSSVRSDSRSRSDYKYQRMLKRQQQPGHQHSSMTGDEGGEADDDEVTVTEADDAGTAAAAGAAADAGLESHSRLAAGGFAAAAAAAAAATAAGGDHHQQQSLLHSMLFAPGAGLPGMPGSSMPVAAAAAPAPAGHVHDGALLPGSAAAEHSSAGGGAVSSWMFGDITLPDDLWSSDGAAGAMSGFGANQQAVTSAAEAAELAATYERIDQQVCQHMQLGDMQRLLSMDFSSTLGSPRPAGRISEPSGPFQQQQQPGGGNAADHQAGVVLAAPAAPAGNATNSSESLQRHMKLQKKLDDLLEDMMAKVGGAAAVGAGLKAKQQPAGGKPPPPAAAGGSGAQQTPGVSQAAATQDSAAAAAKGAASTATLAATAAAAAAAKVPGLSPTPSFAPSDSLTHVSDGSGAGADANNEGATAAAGLLALLGKPAHTMVERALQDALKAAGIGRATAAPTTTAAGLGAQLPGLAGLGGISSGSAAPTGPAAAAATAAAGGMGSLLASAVLGNGLNSSLANLASPLGGGLDAVLLAGLLGQPRGGVGALLLGQQQMLQQQHALQLQLLQKLAALQQSQQPLNALLAAGTVGQPSLAAATQLGGLQRQLLPVLPPQLQQQQLHKPAISGEVVEVLVAQMQDMQKQINSALAPLQSQMCEMQAELRKMQAAGGGAAAAAAAAAAGDATGRVHAVQFLY